VSDATSVVREYLLTPAAKSVPMALKPYIDRALQAAHAAGKAEGRAECIAIADEHRRWLLHNEHIGGPGFGDSRGEQACEWIIAKIRALSKSGRERD